MLLVLHLAVALSSVGFSSYLFISPAKFKFYISYCLIGLTLITGTLLVILTHAPILSSCLSGLVYVAVVTLLVALAQRRLATATTKH